MNLKILFVALLLLLVGNKGLACDVCGCSMTQLFWGLQSGNQNFVGLWWQQQGYRNLANGEQSMTREQFQVFELRGRYSLHRRVQLLGILPYAINQRQSGTLQGIGDAFAMASYAPIDQSDSLLRVFKHRLSLGLGLKMPTGEFEQPASDAIVYPGFQVGTGSWDLLFNLSYTLRWRDMGLNADASWRKNGYSSADYHFGNRLNAAVNVFRSFPMGRTDVMPSVGVLYDHAHRDVERGYFRTDTGGEALFANLGCELYWNRYHVGFNVNLPISEQWNNALVEAQPRLTARMNVFF
ncbi:MAG TPA: hypothetical protein PKA00_05610 [Saprospiraceae bacterium]|nr:hypothetical protein [Saprospiraceae bacterium]HMQ82358.1 hypothetical protein [Saprospiraceae bacterium]